MALFRVTQGACQGYPISGCRGAYLRGQVTSHASLATGAARSEPSGLLWRARGVPQRCVPGLAVLRVVPGCTQGAGVHGGAKVRALHQGGRVHIRGILKARLGQGRGQGQCQKLCNNGARTSAIMAITTTRPPDTPTTQHPTSGTPHH